MHSHIFIPRFSVQLIVSLHIDINYTFKETVWWTSRLWGVSLPYSLPQEYHQWSIRKPEPNFCTVSFLICQLSRTGCKWRWWISSEGTEQPRRIQLTMLNIANLTSNHGKMQFEFYFSSVRMVEGFIYLFIYLFIYFTMSLFFERWCRKQSEDHLHATIPFREREKRKKQNKAKPWNDSIQI